MIHCWRLLTAISVCAIGFCGVGSVAVCGDLWTPLQGRAPKAGDEYISPTDKSVLVWIPEGEFQMGSHDHDADEKPRHKVRVKGFWLGKYEVTNKQYLLYVKVNDKPQTPFLDHENMNKPNQPVTAVKFNEAVKYLKWAKLRFPTEAEWEYAAAGGRQLLYPTIDGTLNHDLANYWGTAGKDVWQEGPAPVGSFPANPFGIHDLACNLWEWTSSLYNAYPYIARDGREDMNLRYRRVMRGGSWQFSKDFCRTSHRHHFAMHLRYDFAGMRVAKSAVSWKKTE